MRLAADEDLLLHLMRQKKNGGRVWGFSNGKSYKHNHSQYGI